MDRQILLRILPDSLYQLLSVSEQLVGIVVKRRIVQESAGSAFTLVETIGNVGEPGHGVLQLIGELLVLGKRS